MILVKIEKVWRGMSCRVCSRGITGSNGLTGSDNNIDDCDLNVPGANNDGYCALFIPNEDKVKTKREIVGMMERHCQRWIREHSNFN